MAFGRNVLDQRNFCRVKRCDAMAQRDSTGSDRQIASVSFNLTKYSGLRAEAELSERGVYAVAALASAVLLTAVLVFVAVKEGGRAKAKMIKSDTAS